MSKKAPSPTAKKMSKAEARAVINSIPGADAPAPVPQASSKKKIRVVEACAVGGCFLPPEEGKPFCLSHLHAANKLVERKREQEAIISRQAAALGAFAAAEAAPAAKPSLAQVKANKGNKASADEMAALKGYTENVMNALRAKGWTDRAIGAALSIDPGTVWNWRNGTACRRIDELKALFALDAPVVEAKAKTGSIKAPSARKSQAAKSVVAPAEPDPRQMILDLQSEFNSQLLAIAAKFQK